jgi:hypothetical protein
VVSMALLNNRFKGSALSVPVRTGLEQTKLKSATAKKWKSVCAFDAFLIIKSVEITLKPRMTEEAVRERERERVMVDYLLIKCDHSNWHY